MLDISQTTHLLTSMGVSGTLAARAAERTAKEHPDADPLTFLKELRNTLEHLADASGASPKPASSASATAATYTPTASAFTPGAERAASSSGALTTKPANATAPFRNLEEFKAWEKNLGDTFAADYEPPDYIRMATMMMSGGDDTVVDRFLFFKNHPEFAADYEAIRNGQLSRFPTDGSTLVKSDLASMPSETAAYYKANPQALLAAEGFSMDPTLARQRMQGEIAAPFGVNISEWLTENKWTRDGVVAQNNRLTFANADYIGLDGKGAGTYKLARLDHATGNIINFDGRVYDRITGEPKA